MRDIVKSPRVVLLLGLSLYIFCLCLTCPQLESKGYLLAILALGIFSIVAYYQSTTAWFARLCHLMLLLAAGLLLVGVWNMPFTIIYKAISVTAWFACMYGFTAYMQAWLKPIS